MIVLDLLFILIPVGYFFFESKGDNRKRFKESLSKLGIKKLEKKDLVKSIELLALMIAITLVVVFLGDLFGFQDTEKIAETIMNLRTDYLLLLNLLIITVFAEEMFFRGLLVKKFGVLAAGLLFGLAHYGYGSITEVFGAAVLGIVLGYYYKKYDNLFIVYVAHAAYNLFAIFVI